MRWFSFLLCCFFSSPTFGIVVINEVYYDHPGRDDGFEFIELINTEFVAESLAGYALQFRDGNSATWKTVWSANASASIGSDSLFVIGEAMVAPTPTVVTTLGLQNGPDAVRLLRDGVVVDVLGYGPLADPSMYEGLPAPDVSEGVALARVPDGTDSDSNLDDFVPRGPSPGTFNTARHDVSISAAAGLMRALALPAPAFVELHARVANVGMRAVESAAVRVVWTDSTRFGVTVLGDAMVEALLQPGGARDATVSAFLSDGYHFIDIRADYARDERPHNNVIEVVRRIGAPAILISEVMSHPLEGCEEFVELFNAGAAIVDIEGAALRDASGRTASLAPISVPPRSYIVLTRDVEGFGQCYQTAAAVYDATGTWPTLNHTGGVEADSVTLLDFAGLSIDRIAYPPQPSDSRGHSLERVDLFRGERTHVWRLSPARGGSPGRAAAGVVDVMPSGAALQVEPRAFDPYAGEQVTITLAPRATDARATLRVFDSDGWQMRVVGTTRSFPFVFAWRGDDDDGRLVVPGIYILTCEFLETDSGRRYVERVVLGCGKRKQR